MRLTAIILLLLGLPLQARATVAFNGAFGSNMVLQRGKPVHVWGTAAVGEGVTVTFAGQSVGATGDANGNWSLYLAAMAANTAGQVLQVQGSANTVTFSNVVVGDVWFCSGQSNMQFQLDDPVQWGQQIWPSSAVPNGPTDATTCNLPNLRFLYVPVGQEISGNFVYNTPATPQTACPPTTAQESGWGPVSGWNACVASTNPAIVDYSAIGFYYGRAISQDLGIPVGIINDAIGGTPAEAFVSAQALQAEPSLSAVVPFITAGAAAKTALGQTTNQWPTGEFNGSINPFTPMTIRGFLWDQGEANTAAAAAEGNGIDASQYATLFSVMIKDWRARWAGYDAASGAGAGVTTGETLPFYFVQLQNMSDLASSPPPVDISWADNCDVTQDNSAGQAGNSWGLVREGQFLNLGLPATGMSVNYDDNIEALYYNSNSTLMSLTIYHSPNKQFWAGRLTPIAESQDYGVAQPGGICMGPHYLSCKFAGSAVTLTFDSPLGTTDGAQARGFAVGNGGSWAWADTVTIAGSTATVSSSAISAPTIVRYAWSMNPTTDPNCGATYSANLSDPSGKWLVPTFQTVSLPIANVVGNGVGITDNDLSPTAADSRDFGSVTQGDPSCRTFTLQNLGTATLTLSGSPLVVVAGADAPDFTVTSQPASSVAPGGSTTFTVCFNPSANGLRLGTLEIPSNDPIRTPYYVFLKGTGTLGTPTVTPNLSPTPSFTPSPSFTASPAVSATPTSTVTPACTGGLISNFDNDSTQNAFGFYWFVYANAGSTILPSPLTLTAPGYGGSGYCAAVSGSNVNGSPAELATSFAATGTNVSVYSGISFEFKGDGGKYLVGIHSLVEGANYNDYTYTFTPPVGWSLVTVPWSAFAFPGWGPAYSLDTTELTTLEFEPVNTGSYSFAVDTVAFTCPAAPTFTASPTVAPPSPTGSPTGTPFSTPSPTPTLTAQGSPTPTATGSPTGTPSASPSASPTASPSPSGTPSATDSATPSASPSASPTPSQSATLTCSPTLSPSFTASPTFSVSPTDSASPTLSPSFTISATYSVSPTQTATETPSATPSATQSATASPSATASASPTLSATASPSPTASASATPSSTVSASPSSSPSASPTPTVSPTLTGSVTLTASPTASPTATLSQTSPPSPTATGSPSVTLTFTAPPTATATPVAGATSAPSASPSATAGSAPANSPTPGIPGPLQILALQPCPNPNPEQVAVELDGRADSLRLRVYSVAENCEAEVDSGPAPQGWSRVSLPATFLRSAPNGEYFVVVTASRGGAVSLPAKPARLVFLR